MKKIILTILILLATANISYGAVSWSGNTCTITGDATVAQINDCLTGAVNGIVAQGKTGEITVVLPADTQTWTSGIGINMGNAAYINVTKLTIQGAGTIPTGSTKGSAGSTVITIETSYPIVVTNSTSKKFRWTNTSFVVNLASLNENYYLFTMDGTTLPSSGGGFRIDHNTFTTTQRGRQVFVRSRSYGVIDHNYYRGNKVDKWFGMFASVGESQTGAGSNLSWYRGIGVNSIDQVFFEDNDIGGAGDSGSATMACDCVEGGRVVLRHNTIMNMYMGGHGADTVKRSCLSYVAYDNAMSIIDSAIGNMSPLMGFRDGTNIIYDNAITETRSGVPTTNSMYAGPIYLRNYRSNAAWSTANTSPYTNLCTGGSAKGCFGTLVAPKACTTDADCGSEVGSCVTIDGLTGDNGYPCRDQTGITSTGGLGANQLVAYPSLFSNNTLNGTYKAPVVPTDSYNDVHIQNNRDYCHHTTTLPATCNGIATTYVEYTYPHPLVSGAADVTAPTISAVTPTGTQPSCTGDSDDYTIGVTAQDNVAVTGVKCCAAGAGCTNTTTYGDMDLTLSYVSGENWTKTETVACNTTNKTYYCRATDGARYSSSHAIVFSTPDGSDAVVPTMTAQALGADGRTLTMTFSEPVTIGAGGSAGFTLTNGASEEIPITYVSGANSDTLVYQTASCIPSTDTFTGGLVYTQPTNGIEDLAENDLASFTGGSAKTITNGSTQSCDLATSLFEHGESAPSGSTNASGNALNLGVKFRTSTAGTMTHCWFYKIAADTGTHTCTVYRVLDGSTVGTVDFADESESGWQDQAFASALNIAANEDYIVTVSHPTGNWTSNVDYFASTYTNGNLTATTAGTDYPGRYVYGASMAYPTNDSARNYWTDFTMSYAGVGGPWQCTVSRTGDGCMVTGSQVITDGNTCSATVTLRNGWKATWGGTCPAGSETGGIYTTGNLSADCTVVAACTEQRILP